MSTSVPPDGTATVSSSKLPAKAKSQGVSIEEDDQLLAQADALSVILPGLSNNDRLLTCASFGTIHYNTLSGETMSLLHTKPQVSALYTRALMSICFEMVEFLAHQGAARAQTRQSGCAATLVSVKVSIKKTKAGYEVKGLGTPRYAKSGPLAITCTDTAAGIDLNVAARGKAKLRSVVGPTVQVGIVNTATTGVDSPVSVQFAAPR